MPREWVNWGQTATCTPARVEVPESVERIQELVSAARSEGTQVKVVGTGHSFTDIACTTGIQVRLDRLTGLVDSDAQACTATVRAGTTVLACADLLDSCGLGFRNLGDIGYQTVAGAISTGTHGTSATRPSISGQVAALTLVTGTGEVLHCSADENPDVFAAARVGLGALGIITEVTLACEPAYNLETYEYGDDWRTVVDSIDELVATNEHFEFFWFPYTEVALVTRHNRTHQPRSSVNQLKKWFSTVVIGNYLWEGYLRSGRRNPARIPEINRKVVGKVEQSRRIARSDAAFTNERRVRFVEMEYNIPRAEIVPVLERIRALIDREKYAVSFPVEVRFGPAEESWLSPAYDRESAWVAVHMYQGMPYHEYFEAVQEIMNWVDGRPHWGKLHFQTAETLAQRYPRWDDFKAVRDRLDPDRVFANNYLDRVLG